MAMSKNLHDHLAAIAHNLNGCANDPKVLYSTYKLIIKENFGELPAQRKLEDAAKQNYPPALVDLAMLYLNGRYLQRDEEDFKPIRDEKKAVHLLEKAAGMKNQQACLLLATCFCQGVGCMQNSVFAEYYISLVDAKSLRWIFNSENEDGQEIAPSLLEDAICQLEVIPLQMVYAGMKLEVGKTK